MVLHLEEGHEYTVDQASGTADNSGGASAADIDVVVTFDNLKSVEMVLGIYGGPCQGYTVTSINGNQVTVNVKQVPAGQTATITVTAAGYMI